MRNLKIVLAYDGADFSGWQAQPERPTVQGALAAALARVTGEPTQPQGSGRTDAGVHALAQVASVTLASPIPVSNLVPALNHVLPPAVRVLEITEAAPEFHARTSARAKTYRYRVFRGAICPPFLARYVYHHPWPLDEHSMAAAAALVVGEHDFTSVAAVDPERTGGHRSPVLGRRPEVQVPVAEGEPPESKPLSNVRTIFRSEFCREGEELVYTVRGSGFLHHMVRNLMGLFLLAGKGTIVPGEVRHILAARSRSANPGATAPASGLYLVEVEY
jgi:tRNA pseudouridine38-40 synthase